MSRPPSLRPATAPSIRLVGLLLGGLLFGVIACSDSSSAESVAPASLAPVAPIAPGTPSPPRDPSLEAPVYPPMPPAGVGQPVARAQWVAAFTPQFLRLACHPEFFFRQCFQNVDDTECSRRMTQLVTECVSEPSLGMPAVVQGVAQSQQAGFRVGSCAGERYERALLAEGRRISNPRCDDPNNWTQPPQ